MDPVQYYIDLATTILSVSGEPDRLREEAAAAIVDLVSEVCDLRVKLALKAISNNA
tara:strand:- start:1464 stop:1631 length:168 start_codon:yes stop_codon:yes gene_type:complete